MTPHKDIIRGLKKERRAHAKEIKLLDSLLKRLGAGAVGKARKRKAKKVKRATVTKATRSEAPVKTHARPSSRPKGNGGSSAGTISDAELERRRAAKQKEREAEAGS